ncbi:MAG: oligosaccharide flippase family protein, partial [Planctomycetota bacterium]
MPIGLAFSALLARLLSPAEVGAYFLIFAVVTAAAVFSGSGPRPAAIRFAAESVALGNLASARSVLLRAGFLSVLMAVSCAAALWSGPGHALVIKVFGSSRIAAVIGLVGFWALLRSIQLFLSDAFRGLQDMRWAVLLGRWTPTALALPALAAVWVLAGRSDLSTVLLVMTAACLLTALAAGLVLTWKVGLRGGAGRRRVSNGELLRTAWPMTVNGLAGYVLDHSALWVIGALLVTGDVAAYGAAARLALFVGVFQASLHSAAAPVIAELNARERRSEMESSVRLGATIAALPSAALLLVMVVGAEPLLRIVFGPHYVMGAPALRILAAAMMFKTFSGPCGEALAMTGHQTVRMVVSLAACALGVAGAIWGVD